jgi:hypothetical protein
VLLWPTAFEVGKIYLFHTMEAEGPVFKLSDLPDDEAQGPDALKEDGNLLRRASDGRNMFTVA